MPVELSKKESTKLRNAAIIILHSLGFSPLEIGNLFGLTMKSVQSIYTGQGSRVFIKETLLTTAQAAGLLGVHTNTIRRWSDSGRIHSVRIGSREDRRFRREDIEKLLRG